MSFNLILLYLTPEWLFQSNNLLKLQWDVSKTIIPCFLKALYHGDVEVRLHEFDKIITGLKDRVDSMSGDIFAKIAITWYYFTRVTHQSLGPRVGNLAQSIIKDWINSSNKYSMYDVDIVLRRALSGIFGVNVDHRNKIDFVAKSKDGKSVAFIELRMSEHTGGRTGQESLMDKFDKILDLIIDRRLLKAALEKRVDTIELVIAILFNEQHELIKGSNYSEGRLNSLINYIMEENHIWGRVKQLKELNFKICDGSDISKDIVNDALKSRSTRRSVCLEGNGLKIYLKILLGDEFFKEYTGLSFEDLVKKYAKTIADDIWVMYMLTVNELKIAKLAGVTNVRRIYDISKREQGLRQYLDRFRGMYTSGGTQGYRELSSYIEDFNKLLSGYVGEVLELYSREGKELRLLETNDMAQNYLYLRYVCAGSLALYLTVDVRRDSRFSNCRWEESLG